MATTPPVDALHCTLRLQSSLSLLLSPIAVHLRLPILQLRGSSISSCRRLTPSPSQPFPLSEHHRKSHQRKSPSSITPLLSLLFSSLLFFSLTWRQGLPVHKCAVFIPMLPFCAFHQNFRAFRSLLRWSCAPHFSSQKIAFTRTRLLSNLTSSLRALSFLAFNDLVSTSLPILPLYR